MNRVDLCALSAVGSGLKLNKIGKLVRNASRCSWRSKALHNGQNGGIFYNDGENGFPLDYSKAINFGIKRAYAEGNGVEEDMQKALHYTKKAAMMGDVSARYNLECA